MMMIIVIKQPRFLWIVEPRYQELYAEFLGNEDESSVACSLFGRSLIIITCHCHSHFHFSSFCSSFTQKCNFSSDPGIHGIRSMVPDVTESLTHWCLVVLTDVTLVDDEDTDSILAEDTFTSNSHFYFWFWLSLLLACLTFTFYFLFSLFIPWSFSRTPAWDIKFLFLIHPSLAPRTLTVSLRVLNKPQQLHWLPFFYALWMSFSYEILI